MGQLLIGGWQLAAIIRSSMVSFLVANCLGGRFWTPYYSFTLGIVGHAFRLVKSQERTAGSAQQQAASRWRDIAGWFAAQLDEAIDHNDLLRHPIKRSVSFADVIYNDHAVLKYSHRIEENSNDRTAFRADVSGAMPRDRIRTWSIILRKFCGRVGRNLPNGHQIQRPTTTHHPPPYRYPVGDA